jgi:hypothetical protein
MKNEKTNIFIGSTQTKVEPSPVEGGYVQLLGESWYRIKNYDQMPPWLNRISRGDR